jgi:hypothetical protein
VEKHWYAPRALTGASQKYPPKQLWRAQETTLKQAISTAPHSLNRIGGFATHGYPCCAFSMTVMRNFINKPELI